jgi:ferredoxin-thioredoxin reductase catalytic subunit
LTNIEELKKIVENNAKNNGYYLIPDPILLKDLLEGLQKNEERYGYPLCPCRLGSGKIELDRDIICPCYYRDQDIAEYSHCYCGLYVNIKVKVGKKAFEPIPERRTEEKQLKAYRKVQVLSENRDIFEKTNTDNLLEKGFILWYCEQCGYVCFREEPPSICPICKARKEFFSKIPREICKYLSNVPT